MGDPHEIDALKASLRGALAAGESLASLRQRIEGIEPHAGIDAAELEEIARIAATHAVAAAALRGLIETMIARRASPRTS